MRVVFLSLIGIVAGTVTTPRPLTIGAAAVHGDMAAVRRFIEEGVDWDSDQVEVPPVDTALVKNRMKIYRYLRNVHGADVNRASGPSAWTPLHHAVGFGDLASVRAVLDDGSSIEARERISGWTPLLQSMYVGDVEVIRELINRGADIHVKNNRGFNPLMAAILHRRKDIALELIAMGSDVNVRALSGRQETPLIMAAAAGWEDVATALIEAGAHVENRDIRGSTAQDIARTLVSEHARPEPIDRNFYDEWIAEFGP